MFLGRLALLLALLGASSPSNRDGSAPLTTPAELPPGAFEVTQGGWQITSLLEDAGLGGRFIFIIDFDEAGNLWAATGDGLHSYDGYTWKRYSTEDGLPSDFVRCLTVANDGRVWIGTDAGIAVLNEPRRITPLPDAGLAGPNVRRIVEDRDGTLWFCSDTWLNPNVSSGVASLRQGVWTTYTKDDGLPSDYVSDYFHDSQGRRFVLTDSGLAQWSGRGWVRPLEELGLDDHDEYFWSIVEVPSLGVLATTEYAFFILSDDRWTRITNTVPSFRHPKVTATSDGELFALPESPEKVFLAWDETGFVPSSASFHDHGWPEYLTEAPDGSIWAVGYSLLLRLVRSAGEWTEYSGIATPLLADREGGVWLAAGPRVLRYKDDTWESFPFRIWEMAFGRGTDLCGWYKGDLVTFTSRGATLEDAAVTGVNEIGGFTLDQDGSIWLHGLDEDGHNVVSVFDGSLWKARRPVEMQDGEISGDAPHPSGGVWYLVLEERTKRPRLVHLDRSQVQDVYTLDIETGRNARLHIGYRGHPWVFGHFGLYVLMNGLWEHVECEPGQRVTSAANGNGEIWFSFSGHGGGRAGLGRLAGDSCTFFDIDVVNRVGGCNADGAGFFAGMGVLYTSAAESGEPPLRLTLPFFEKIRSVVRGPGEDLWIGACKSVFHYTPDGIAPQTVIADVQHNVFDGEPLSATFSGIEHFKPQGSGTFTYSWRFDSGAWTDFAPAPVDGLPLSLGAGTHTLEVRARDEGLDVDATPARTTIEILAIPLQQRWWFWPVVGTLFAVVVFLAGVAAAAWKRTRFYAGNLERIIDERTGDLRQSEDRYRGLVELSPDLIAIHTDETIVFINEAGARMLKAAHPEEVIGKPVLQFVASGERERIAERVNGALKDKKHLPPDETILVGVDGTRVAVEATAVPFIYRGKHAIQVIARDITERKRAERARVRLTTILEQTPDLVSMHEANGRVFYINGAGRRLLGIGQNENLAGVTISDVHPDSARELVLNTGLPAALRDGTWYGETVLLARDGRHIPVSQVIIAHRSEDRAVEYFSTVVRDMTERKQVEEALEASKARFRAIADYAHDWENWVGPDGKLLWVNPAVQRITGYTPEECMAMESFPLPMFHEDERERWSDEFEGAVVRRTSGNDMPVRIRCKDGSVRWCAVSWQPIYNSQGGCMGHRSSVRDISKRKKIAEELEKAKEAAEAASNAKSVFLANLSHEVRTPIMAMLGAAESAGTVLQGGPPGIQTADIIQRNGRLLLSLFDDLLDAAHMTVGKFRVNRAQHSLPDILANIRLLANMLQKNRDVELKFFREGPVPTRINTDPIRLQQVVINLISNALKFTDSGGSVHVRVKVDRHGDEPRLCIAVEDTGLGIPQGDLDRIFEMFEQVDATRRPGCGGAGLGLPLANWIAGELGGDLKVTSELARGSTFVLRVATGPIEYVDWTMLDEAWDSAGVLAAAGDDPRPEPRLSGSILLAEDFQDARDLIRLALADAGAQVDAVSDGEAAVKAVSQRGYDLILMDVRMPIKDGETAVAELRREGCLTPIIALTASTAEQKRERLLEAGFDDVWSKPIALGEIAKRVACYISVAGEGKTAPSQAGTQPVTDLPDDPRYATVVDEFAQSLPAQFSAIQRAVESGDSRAAREILHQIAGTGGTMGFPALSEEAGRVLSRSRKDASVLRKEELHTLAAVISDIARRTHSAT
ncbi:MAG: PAS domain S-box protein [Phycisphaerales bacterium]|nr:MAG: PAS domain S-box protein [Phycisphaerales bacterium]